MVNQILELHPEEQITQSGSHLSPLKCIRDGFIYHKKKSLTSRVKSKLTNTPTPLHKQRRQSPCQCLKAVKIGREWDTFWLVIEIRITVKLIKQYLC